jgi:hypothetical protein
MYIEPLSSKQLWTDEAHLVPSSSTGFTKCITTNPRIYFVRLPFIIWVVNQYLSYTYQFHSHVKYCDDRCVGFSPCSNITKSMSEKDGS